jgi:hypothetical protein
MLAPTELAVSVRPIGVARQMGVVVANVPKRSITLGAAESGPPARGDAACRSQPRAVESRVLGIRHRASVESRREQ